MPHFADSSSTAPQRDLTVRSKEDVVAASEEGEGIRRKNRRKRYLDLHPQYFDSSDLELADPLLYDRLIRRFQTTQEREQEGRQRGYTRNLEADLVRSEAKLEALQHPDPNSPIAYRRAADGSITGVEADEDDRAQSRGEGRERWIDVMTQRFMRGEDKEFDYVTVDENEAYDDREEEDRNRLDEYLEAESEEFVCEGKPVGETGVQDF